MSTDNCELNFHLDKTNLKLHTGMLIALILIVFGVTLWSFSAWVSAPKTGWGTFVFAGTLIFLVAIFVPAFGGMRLYRRALSSGEASSYAVTVLPDSVVVSTRTSHTQVNWSDIVRVSSDKELLHSGLMAKETYTALLLVHDETQLLTGFGLRRSLRASVLRRALFYPFPLPGMTVIPVYFFTKHDAKRLIAAAQERHAQYLASHPDQKDQTRNE